jgi:hypothetical protein
MPQLEFTKCFGCNTCENINRRVKLVNKKGKFVIVGCVKEDIFIIVPERTYYEKYTEELPEEY